MNKLFILVFALASTVTYSQVKTIKHTVVKGETVYRIATENNVTISDILELNPTAEIGINENQILIIPFKLANNSVNPSTHEVEPKETLYGIARLYSIPFGDLKKLNEADLVDGLKIGQVLKIPAKKIVSTTEVKPTTPSTNPVVVKPIVTVEKPKPVVTTPKPVVTTPKPAVFHAVEPKETKYGIAKKYGMTVDELEKLNPEIVESLPIGFKLKVNSASNNSKPISTTSITKTNNTDVVSEKPVQNIATDIDKKLGLANYEVKPKETLYSLSKTFGITQDDLITLNPELGNGVKEGMVLLVPGKGSITVIGNTKYKDLTQTINTTTRKKLAILLPFNVARVQNDSINEIRTRIQKDGFLNMTLDFYSGALIAVEYAKSIGLNLDVKILDSKETKNSSDVENVIKNNDLVNYNAIIGPFYQQYAEQTADLVAKNNVPVISPLSKEIGRPIINLYQTMPPADFAKSTLMDYIVSKKGNIIVVSDPKKQTIKDYISKNYPTAKFAPLSTNGTLDGQKFMEFYDVNKTNFVILDTEKTNLILATTNLMQRDMRNYEQQLVILEDNETLNFEEIAMSRLANLKLLYPSITKDIQTTEMKLFEADYQKKFKALPNKYATRGFDVTFDTMLRMSQDKKFSETTLEDKTEQLETKFEYAKNGTECFINNGVYLLEYQPDLTVKVINE